MFVWHYAPWEYLRAIVAYGALMPSNAAAEREFPLLWFSARQDWEPTATKLLRTSNGIRSMTLAEQKAKFGCVRFGLPADDSRLVSWPEACKLARTGLKKRRQMEAAGRRQGASPDDWFACAGEVSLTGLRFQAMLDDWCDACADEMVDVWQRCKSEGGNR